MRFSNVVNVMCVVAPAMLLAVCTAGPVQGVEPEKKPAANAARGIAQAQKSAERGLAFLETDAAKWRKEKQCATCHHGTMTVWAMSEAKIQGYGVNPDTYADNVNWTKERLKNIDKPRDTRPGWKMVSTPALYLAVMARAIPAQTAVSPDELAQIRRHLVRHQEEDGSWAWSSAPPQNRPPPFFESDEVATLLGLMAMEDVRIVQKDGSLSRGDAQERAVAWLAKSPPSGTTQEFAFWVLRHYWDSRRMKGIHGLISEFNRLQRVDGGWGQLPDLPSDAYATGQALYVLGLAGVMNDDKAIQRGVAFLVATQEADGSWPMTSRAAIGGTPYMNPVPITYFGSAWATLGLMRSASK